MASWIPAKDSDLEPFALNFSTLLTANPSGYGIAGTDASAVAAAYASWHSSYLLVSDPATKTKVTVAAKDIARGQMLVQIRVYGALIRANQGVSQDNKTALGIHLPDLVPTPVPPPSTFPILSFIGATPGQFTMRYADQNTPDKKHKPAGSILLQVYGATSSTVVSDPSVLPFLSLVGRNPFPLSWSNSDKGKIAYMAARWINRRGEPGPWSAIVTSNVI